MTSDEQDKLEKIYSAALRLHPAQRAEYVRQACREDDALLVEIDSLLAHEEQLGSFLEKPAIETVTASAAGESLVGQTLGSYRVESFLGAGGMGKVYRARDTRLGRTVAIKMTAEEFNCRFLTEARAVAALNHPHVCTLYDIGPNYLVMELIEGETLARRLFNGALPVQQVIQYGVEIADALAAAHAQGIIHRDLKPGNIMVTETGVKLLDFGLAKLVPSAAMGAEVPTAGIKPAPQTNPGMAVGTVAYMSPEQARGEELDARTDLFSFGAVLYEMLSGNRAFGGSSTAEVLSAVLRDEPAPLTAPVAIESIVRRCLAKRPSERFPGMKQVRAALGAVSANPAAQQPSIAVLAFANISSSQDDVYFSDGLAEDILNALAHIPGLKVTARTSSFAFRGEKIDIRKIAETLGVRTILEGSVRRDLNRIRVTAQLIDADGYRVWSERYDRELTDVFKIQDEIAAAIVAALQGKLVGEPVITRRPQPSLPAYEAFLKGRHQYFKNTPDAVTRAKVYFEQAIALDPDYAEPHAGLGLYYLFLGAYGVHPGREGLLLVRAEAKKALDLFGFEPGARALLGVVAATYDYDWKEAENHFQLAMAANSIPPEVRVRHALYSLAPRGRFQEAIAEMEKGLEQDPLSVLFRSYLSFILSAAGMYTRAIAEARKALEIDEEFWATQSMMANAYAFQGMFAQAVEWAERAFRLAPWDSAATGLLAALYSRIGNQERAKQIMASPMPSGIGMVLYHLLRSEIDSAADWYEKAIELHEPFAVVWAAHDFTRQLRASRRWPRLAKMMNLPEAT